MKMTCILLTTLLSAVSLTSAEPSVTNTAMLYISAAMTPVVTGANYSIWVAAGMSRFSGGAMVALTAYATNQAALDAGLAVGTLYKTAAGVVMVVQ